ncbi:MAG: hypothetical protein A2846_04885 [Candidatus Doudnabacteria bacterium RIFCSPHIGHO2_01_FULL_49_9]|uniref:Bacterial Ig-like domain-containing protein n=1 Tax=Candidatus Doudnabacteria bacterium RIFCSPHIGHO2_01_FULL_49_9 TaxID=1817827 RepID=A0A1F5P3U2_9BACT|nr:MAG: hypothetical protein A2846_04885 [Candidatus Doudnabacteria bacterium RIFCSPHIGHO2_01_FULL_49_9]
MHKPNRSFTQKVFAAGLAVTTALWAFGGLAAVAGAVESHPAGTLVLSGSTVWHISDDGTMRHGIDSLAKFQSHRYSFANVVPANSADLALPDGGLLGWGSGVLFNDGGTVYQVAGGMKHGFTSAAAFTGSGFSFGSVVSGSLAGVPAGANISDAAMAHKEGTFINSAGTVWMVTATGRKGVPSPGVLYSYGASFGDVVAANAADLTLANEGNATFRTGALVNDGGTIYAATMTAKRGFPSASCYTDFGFNFSMPVSGSTAGLTAGANYCASTTPTPTPTPPTPSSTGTLSVSLASDTPAAGIALKSAARVPFTKIMLSASGGDVVIDSWVVERTGIADDASFSSLDIVDVATNATINESGKTLSSESLANFTEDYLVKSGETKYVMLAGNIAAAPGSGEMPTLTLKTLALKGGSLVGSFPITGNAMTINTSIVIGTATVARGAYTNASSSSMEVGKQDYTFFSFQITAGSAEDVEFSQVKVYQAGSASLTSDMGDFKLLKDGEVIATGGTISGNYISFSFPAQKIEKGQVRQYRVIADVVSGSARTIKLGIWRTTDVLVKGLTYGANLTPTYTGTGSGANQNVLQDNEFTISTGTLRVGRSNTVGSTNITTGTGQVLGAFEFEAKGEPIIITALTLTVSSSTGAQIEDAAQAFKIVDATGKTLTGPTDVTNHALTVAFTDTFTVPIGLNHYKVVSTLATNGGWATNNTITVSINTPASGITAKGETTGQTVTATPASNTSASTQTVKAATLTVTKNSTPTNKSVITNSVGVLAGSWTFDATNSGEDIRITSLAVRASTTGKLNTLTLKDVASTGGTVNKTLSPVNDNPVSSNNANTTSTFALSEPLVIAKGTSKVVDLYVNVGSNANAGEVDAFGLTDTTAATNASVVAYGVTSGNRSSVTLTSHNGATLTIAAAGTLTINEDASSPASRLVVHGSTGTVLSEVRLKATNEPVDITVMKLGVANGGLTGTATGDYEQIAKVYLKLDGTIVGSATGYSLGQANTTLNFDRGVVTIPDGTTGKKLTLAADIVNIGTNEPGGANESIMVGLNGADGGFTAIGNGSNTTLTTTMTYTDSTGSAVILHKAVPSVVVETPSNNLGATAVLHRVKISAVGGQIGLYRLTYNITSSTGVVTSSAYTRLASCTGCGGVADGVQLSVADAAIDYLIDGHGITIHTIDSNQAHGKHYLQISSGATATVDLYASAVLTTNSDTVSTRILGDTATTSPNDTGGSEAAAFGSLNQGNFVWSDLNVSETQGATGAIVSKQWYNGYYVNGLGPTTTTTPVTVGE